MDLRPPNVYQPGRIKFSLGHRQAYAWNTYLHVALREQSRSRESLFHCK